MIHEEVKTIDDLIQWCNNEIRQVELIDHNNKDEWAVARINALEEVIMHLRNIQALSTLI